MLNAEAVNLPGAQFVRDRCLLAASRRCAFGGPLHARHLTQKAPATHPPKKTGNCREQRKRHPEAVLTKRHIWLRERDRRRTSGVGIWMVSKLMKYFLRETVSRRYENDLGDHADKNAK
jgi:hypothetical protein